MYDVRKMGKIFMPTIRKRQDWGLWLIILRKCRVAYGMKEPLAVYRQRPNSISSNKYSLIAYNLNVYRKVLNFFLGKILFLFSSVFFCLTFDT